MAEKYESFAPKIWRLVYPLLTYTGVTVVVSFLASSLLTAIAVTSKSASTMNEMVQYVLELTIKYTYEIQTAAAIVAIPLFCLYLWMDKNRRIKENQIKTYQKAQWWRYLPIIVLGMAACYAGNNMIEMSGLYEYSTEYEVLAESFYKGHLLFEFLGLGFIIPIAEELLFRGLIYKRIKELLPGAAAIIAGAAVFGISHGNLAQGIYAFGIGLLLIYVYERYRTLAAPILFHVAANCLSVVASETGLLDVFYTSPASFFGSTAAGCVILIAAVYWIEKFVDCPEIIKEEPRSNPFTE